MDSFAAKTRTVIDHGVARPVPELTWLTYRMTGDSGGSPEYTSRCTAISPGSPGYVVSTHARETENVTGVYWMLSVPVKGGGSAVASVAGGTWVVVAGGAVVLDVLGLVVTGGIVALGCVEVGDVTATVGISTRSVVVVNADEVVDDRCVVGGNEEVGAALFVVVAPCGVTVTVGLASIDP
jgi:hypothetical protein